MSTDVVLRRKDWALVAISAGGKLGLSPVQLQKSLFILGQEFPRVVGESFYHFEPYDYGPFCRAVYEDAEELEQSGLVSIIGPPSRPWKQYIAESDGNLQATKIVRRRRVAAAVKYLRVVVDWATRVSFQALLRAVYAKYPAYAVRSVFRG